MTYDCQNFTRAKCTVVSSSDSAKQTNYETNERTMAISTFVTLEMCRAYRTAF